MYFTLCGIVVLDLRSSLGLMQVVYGNDCFAMRIQQGVICFLTRGICIIQELQEVYFLRKKGMFKGFGKAMSSSLQAIVIHNLALILESPYLCNTQ